MSQNNGSENICNEEENKEDNNDEIIDEQQQSNNAEKRRGTGLFVQKIINDGKNNNRIYKEPPKQLKNNSAEFEDIQSYPSILRFSNDSKNNGADRFNEKNSYAHNMRNLFKNSKNEGLFSKKENSDELQNNGNDKFEQKNSFIDDKENPYKVNKGNEPNNEIENAEYQDVEKVVFNSQFSMQSNEDEQNINQMSINPLLSAQNDRNVEDNNYKLNFNSSSIVIQDNNEYYNERNNNNYNLNEIKKNDNNDNNDNKDNNNNNANNDIKVRKYNLPSSISPNFINPNPYSDNHQENNNMPNSSINEEPIMDNPYINDNYVQNKIENSINSQTNKEDNNSYNFANSSSINMEGSQMQSSNNMSSQNSSNEQKFNYSQPNLDYNFPTDNSKISNGSKAPSCPDNDKFPINQSEKNVIKIDNNIQYNTPSNPSNPSNSNNQKVSKHLLDRYKKVSKTGLINLDDSSYLNAVLQSLGHVRHFASFFLNPKNQELIKTNLVSMPLAFVTQRLFTHLYPYPESNSIEIYSPESYLEILAFLKSPYGKQRNNPNDLLVFILNTLHYELNTKKNNQQIIRMPPNYYFSVDNVIQNGISNFTNNNNSKISDVVSWFQLSESKCTNCRISTFSFNSFHTYDLDIKNTYEYNLKNGKNYINIYDCLSYGSMFKQSKYYCYNCKSRAISYKQSRIYSPPNVFIFLLDRGIDFNKNNNHIPFIVEEQINLGNFIIKQNTPIQYGLTGIVSFNLQEQKYVSYCQSPIDKNWYLYNDEKVNLVCCQDILKNKNWNDIPCILYYKPI